MKLLAQCHLFCCRACWLLYFISCNQGCFCLPRVIYRVEKNPQYVLLLQKQVSNFLTEQLLPYSPKTFFYFEPHLQKNKSTFLDFIFPKTWKQFPCHAHFHWEITWFSQVRILHRHTPLTACSQVHRLSALLAPIPGKGDVQKKHLLWGPPSLMQFTCT